jgi:hypothetical protein
MPARPLYLTELRTPADWQARLGDPVKHWKRGASAMELAIQWLTARGSETGLPEPVRRLLESCACTRDTRLALAVPEHRTPLEGGATASQSDLWALLEGPNGRVSLIVEGKALEPFDKHVREWLETQERGSSRKSGKPARLEFLCKKLGVSEEAVLDVRYQLLHRTAAALIEAERWGAKAGVMLVERFSATPGVPAVSFPEFVRFAALLGIEPVSGRLHALPSKPEILIGWIDVPVATDREMMAALVA